MENKTELLIEIETNTIDNICPDYDEDCIGLTQQQASWCFHGCQNHKCSPGSNLGTAKGYCPLIHKSN